MRAQITGFLLLVVCCGLVAGDTVGDQCASEFPKVATCLDYATGKENTPSPACCTSAQSLKDKNPVCLCYIIQQIHTGSNPQIKNMGIQEARLLQLPTACKINASTSDCPKLLNLPPNSPDAAIFANSTAAPATPSTATPSTSTPARTDGGSAGFKHGPQLAGPVAIAVAIFLCSFPTGLKFLSSFST